MICAVLTFVALLWSRIRFYWDTRREVYMRDEWLFERRRARELD